jgi:hypothetical protein
MKNMLPVASIALLLVGTALGGDASSGRIAHRRGNRKGSSQTLKKRESKSFRIEEVRTVNRRRNHERPGIQPIPAVA